MTVERELACDDTVLNGGTLPSDYAEQLMAVAVGSRRSWGLGAAVAMARPSKLGERLLAILDPQAPALGGDPLRDRCVDRASCRAAHADVDAEAFRGQRRTNFRPTGWPGRDGGRNPAARAETKLLVRVDLKKVTPESLEVTAKAVVGKADIFDQPIAWYRPLYNTLKEHGVATVWFSLGQTDVSSPVTPVFYLHVAADSDATALESDLKKVLADDQKEATFARDGHYLLIQEPAARPQAPGGASHRKARSLLTRVPPGHSHGL